MCFEHLKWSSIELSNFIKFNKSYVLKFYSSQTLLFEFILIEFSKIANSIFELSKLNITFLFAMSSEEPNFKPLTEAEIAEARQQFTLIDSDRNGCLTENELDSYFRQSKQELRCFPKLIIELYGSNGAVSVDQYLKFYKALSADKNSNEFISRYIFDHIDKDHSGYIDGGEYQKVADLIKLPPGMEQQTLSKAEKMDYNAFSKHFYTLLRMAWRGLVRRNTI